MKKALLLTTAALIFVSTAFAENPLLLQKYTADPNAFVWNDRLYVYASYDNNNPTTSGYDIMFYTLMSTDDMANWTDHGEVFSVKRDLAAFGNAYAPGAAVKNNTVYLYVPNGGSGIGVAKAVHPAGPFTDGKSFISGNSGNNTAVPWLFDPAGFVDTDGQGYVYFGGGPADGNPGPGSNLRGAKLNADMMSAQWPATTITPTPRSFEAAYMHKRDNTYYFSFSQNFNGSADIYYVSGSSPLGPFNGQAGVMLPNSASGGGNNHASVVQYKNNWYIFYHDRKLQKGTSGAPSGERRSVSADKLEYNTNGSIKQVVPTDAGPAQIKNFNPYDTVLATTMNTQSKNVKTAICSAPNPGTITNGTAASAYNSPGDKGDKCVMLLISNDGSWVRLKNVAFTNGATIFRVRAASTNTNAAIEIRTGSQTGALAGTCTIGSTGGLTTWQEKECTINMSAGTKDYLYLVFKGNNFRVSKYLFKNATPSSSSAVPSSSSRVASSSSRAASSSSIASSSSRAVSSSSIASSSSRAVSSSSRAVSSSSNGTTGPLECGEYKTSFCGGLAYGNVPSNSTAVPTTGNCLYIGEFEQIQPSLNSTVAINGVETTLGDEWSDSTKVNDSTDVSNNHRPKPAKKDGGYYVYVKTGGINTYQDNGWRGIVAKALPACVPPVTPSSSSEGETPILNSQFSTLNSNSPTYYNIKGEPLGNVKPQRAGVYIVKQGSSVKKISVR